MSALVMHPLKAQKQVAWKVDWRKSGATNADLIDESGVILTLGCGQFYVKKRVTWKVTDLTRSGDINVDSGVSFN